MKNDACPLNMLLRPVAIGDNRGKLRSLFSGDNETDGLSHDIRMACFVNVVNPLSVSVH
jgi:hypothetical protein